MRIFSISFLSSSYIVITIQYLKALWGRPHRNKIDRLFWGHSMKKTKKTLRKPKKQKKTKKKKQYFQTLLGSLHEKNKKTLRKQKKQKKQKKQYLETISRAPPQRIAKYCFFLVFSRFFGFFHGVTPEESENIVFFVFFGFLKVFLVFSWSDPRRL